MHRKKGAFFNGLGPLKWLKTDKKYCVEKKQKKR